jgi:hypothetical protein
MLNEPAWQFFGIVYIKQTNAMKKFLVVAALALFAAQPLFARNGEVLSGETVSAKAVSHFNATYSGINGFWSTEKNYSEVLFFWKNTLMDSFYDANGDLIGTFHDLAPKDLSAKVRGKIASWYKGYEIKSISMMQRDNEDDVIYVKVQNAKHLRILEVSADGSVVEFQTIQ